MNTIARVAKNSIALFIGQANNILLNVLILGLIARYLGVEGYGQYYYIYAFIIIFEVASDFGARSIIVREIAKAREKAAEFLGSAIILKAFTTIITMAFVYLVAQFQIEAALRPAFYLAGLAAVTQISTDLFSWLFRGFEKMEYDTVFGVINKIVLLLLVILGIHFKFDLYYFFLNILLANIVRIIAEAIFARKKFVSPKFSSSFKSLKLLLFQSVPLGLSVLLMITSRRINIFLLGFLSSAGEVGLFSSAFVIVTALVFIPTTFTSAAFPIFSQLANTSKKSLSKPYEMSFKLLSVLGVPITVGLFMLADKFILLVFGEAFLNAAIVMKIMSISLLFRFLNFLFRFILTSINKQTFELVSVSISLLVSGTLGYFLISTWGANGAALTLLIAELVVFVIKFTIVSKSVSVIPLHKIIAKPIIAALLMGIVIFFLRELNLFFLIFIGGGIYISTLLLLKNFSAEELDIFKKALPWQMVQAKLKKVF